MAERLCLRTTEKAWQFGLVASTRLPITISGMKFFVSGHKKPGEPWILRLRGRVPPRDAWTPPS